MAEWELKIGEKVKLKLGDEVRTDLMVYGEGKLPTPAPLAPNPRSAAPSIAKAPYNAGDAKHHQQRWAEFLKTHVVKPNSIGMQMVLIPPCEFLMGSSNDDLAFTEQTQELPQW